MEKKILVVVDMQNDFIDGALGSKEAVKIVDNCVAKVKEAFDNNDTHCYKCGDKNILITLMR